MRKLVLFVLIFTIVVNVIVVVSLMQERESQEKCSATTVPKIELKDVNPGIFFGLIRMSTFANQ